MIELLLAALVIGDYVFTYRESVCFEMKKLYFTIKERIK